MGVLLLGLITGIAFGYILLRAGVSQCGCIFDALNLLNLKAIKLMLTAVATAIFIVYPLAAFGLVAIGGKTLYVGGVLVGGLIFGAGFAMAGYCPGTALAALGGGRTDGAYALVGGLFGALAYALVYERLEPLLIQPLNYGRHNVAEALGLGQTGAGLFFGALLVAVIYGIDRWEKQRAQMQQEHITLSPVQGPG